VRVLLLGAGASKCAGYPLANELIPAIKREAETTSLYNLKSPWSAWEEFVRAQHGALALLLNNPNREVVLSVVDLCEIGSVEEQDLGVIVGADLACTRH
jgi:hypothetical protein